MRTVAHALVLMLLVVPRAVAMFPFATETEVAPPEREAIPSFGTRVAISGNTAVVAGTDAAYVYVRRNEIWTFQQKVLLSENPAEQTGSFVTVAVDGNDLVLGGGQRGARRLAIFRRDGNRWVRAPLNYPYPVQSSYSVALHRGTLLLGVMDARLEADGDIRGSGMAYVFVRSSGEWRLQGKLIGNDPPRAWAVRVGRSVSIDGNTAAVGVGPDAPLTYMGPGTAYVFTRNGETWTQEAKLEEVMDSYSKTVAVEGNTLAIGDPDRSEVVIYQRGAEGWTLQERFTGLPKTQFGCSVALKNHRLLIGANHQTMWWYLEGSAYLYLREPTTGHWTFRQQLTRAEDARPMDFFGNSVALSDHSGIVGAPHRVLQGTSAGMAHIYDSVRPLITLLAPSNITVEATSSNGAVVTFNGTATDIDDSELPVTFNIPSGSTFPLGATTVWAFANDAAGNGASSTFTVTVRDTTPPEFDSLTARPRILRPANGRFVTVTVSAVIRDAVDPDPSVRIARVMSNEPVGATRPDWIIIDESTVQLRAERGHSGSARTYTIIVEARDAAYNPKRERLTVRVP